ncbi:MAG: sigma-70 family RNA polymerase sigma factor [Verrucomicrobiota bacterium]|nr:sigma-70 family RNA polymerase sigma factor [Verrucomicrobiota bacterium]
MERCQIIQEGRSKMSDLELIKEFLDENNAAYEELIIRYTDKAYRVAFGILRNKLDAEEITQDAFLKIYKNLKTFRGDSKFSSWLYRIVSNLAKNKYNWNKRRNIGKNIPLDQKEDKDSNNITISQIKDVSAVPPDKKLQGQEFMKKINKGIDSLPEHYKEVLTLRHLDDMSYEEIAKITETKLGTVKSRIARARDELRNFLS